MHNPDVWMPNYYYITVSPGGMEIVILIGIQGTGKSTLYRERFVDTHVRINLVMLRRVPASAPLWKPVCVLANALLWTTRMGGRPNAPSMFVPRNAPDAG
jgi:hypothetical protein